jgi:serine/threonine protein kinase
VALQINDCDLCLGCFKPKNGEAVCPECGYIENSPYLPSYLAPGTVLNDRYVIGKLKSYNGEGAIYIGYDKVTEAKVYVKEYMPDTLCSREKGSSAINVNPNCAAQYKTFMSEFVELNKMLTKMRTLNHIVPATDMFGDNNTGYVVFSYFEGITLSEYLKQNAGELSWEEVKVLFPPILTTLSLIHNAGLVHRGISPETIYISNKGEIKITGFCIADARTANTELASELFSGYAAPEQYNSNNWQGTWTDVYAIAAVLYRTLTGVIPNDAMSRMVNDTLIEPAKLNGNIPRNVSKVIMNGLLMNGEMRIQTVTEFVTQLFEQPEYNSVRLSSSSTQTISIPQQKQYQEQSRRTAVPARKAPSRHGVFLMTGGIAMIVGLIFLVIVLVMLDDSSSALNDSDVADITDITTSYSDTSDTLDTEQNETEQEKPSSSTIIEETSLDMALMSGNGTIYVMTDLYGKSFDAIKNSETYKSLVFKPEYEYNDEIAKGLIFEQSIKENENYTEGAEISVKVSLGPKLVEVPEYESLNKKDYFNILDGLGIKYEEKAYKTADVMEGYVVKLSKEPGEKINIETGEVLTVYVAVKAKKAQTTTQSESTPQIGETIYMDDEPGMIITDYN